MTMNGCETWLQGILTKRSLRQFPVKWLMLQALSFLRMQMSLLCDCWSSKHHYLCFMQIWWGQNAWLLMFKKTKMVFPFILHLLFHHPGLLFATTFVSNKQQTCSCWLKLLTLIWETSGTFTKHQEAMTVQLMVSFSLNWAFADNND